MSEHLDLEKPLPGEYIGVYENGVIRLTIGVDWPEGTAVLVRMACLRPEGSVPGFQKVIVAGFGLAGRSVAGICERYGIDYVIVERNTETIERQRDLGRHIIDGDISDEDTLRRAGIEEASILALTVPDNGAILQATRLAKAMNPHVYVIGQTLHSSTGMQIENLGADDMIKVEQVVAREFYELLLRRLACRREAEGQPAVLGSAPRG